jgi:hypothetical protein
MDLTEKAQKQAAEIKLLQEHILKWQKWLTFFGASLIVGYVLYFGVKLNHSASVDPERWGQFGDFFGGILNPLVAFAAFYWLTQSVKLQKQELADTRDELRLAAEAQKELVDNGRMSIKLAALTAIISAIDGEMVNLNRVIKESEDSYKSADELSPQGSYLVKEKVVKERDDAIKTSKELAAERADCLKEMRAILRGAAPQ